MNIKGEWFDLNEDDVDYFKEFTKFEDGKIYANWFNQRIPA